MVKGHKNDNSIRYFTLNQVQELLVLINYANDKSRLVLMSSSSLEALGIPWMNLYAEVSLTSH